MEFLMRILEKSQAFDSSAEIFLHNWLKGSTRLLRKGFSPFSCHYNYPCLFFCLGDDQSSVALFYKNFIYTSITLNNAMFLYLGYQHKLQLLQLQDYLWRPAKKIFLKHSECPKTNLVLSFPEILKEMSMFLTSLFAPFSVTINWL